MMMNETAPAPNKAAAKAVSQGAAGMGAPLTVTKQVEAFSTKETGEEASFNIAASELKNFIERIERLEEEKNAINGDVRDVLGEAKGRGYDTKAIRTILKLRKKDASERMEEETILQTYMAALGME